jgi:rubredoxin
MADDGWRIWQCGICGDLYDEAAGMPDQGIAPGTRLEDLPDDWICPMCGSPKGVFIPYEA